jgi:hypothetical protein
MIVPTRFLLERGYAYVRIYLVSMAVVFLFILLYRMDH